MAFHRLPDLIGELCNIHPFDHFISGPGKITVASGLLEVTYPILLNNSVAFARAFNLATPSNLLHLYQYFHIGLDYTFNSKKKLGLIIKILVKIYLGLINMLILI